MIYKWRCANNWILLLFHFFFLVLFSTSDFYNAIVDNKTDGLPKSKDDGGDGGFSAADKPASVIKEKGWESVLAQFS